MFETTIVVGQKLLSRYTLTAMIGEGGMGTVFCALDTLTGEIRAIKVLRPNLAGHSAQKDAFLKEARILMALRHPNIVAVYNVEQEGDTYFIIMEFVLGKTVKFVLDSKGALGAQETLRIIDEILFGISVAHQKGIVHRDIKPENVLMSETGDVRIIDFGIAKMRDPLTSETKTGVVMGTWGYMAPEQGDAAKNADKRSDIYSVGALLYTLCTGKTPTNLFMAGKDTAILEGILAPIAAIVKKACEYDPLERYQSAAEMRDAVHAAKRALPDDAIAAMIAHAVDELPVRVRTSSTPAPMTPQNTTFTPEPVVREYRHLVGAGALVIALCLGAVAWRHGEVQGEKLEIPLPEVAPTLVEDSRPQATKEIAVVDPDPVKSVVHHESRKVEGQKAMVRVASSVEARIVHKLVRTAKAGSSVTISVRVENAQTDDVMLFSRQKGGDAGWEGTAMRATNGVFMASFVATSPGIEYYIDARPTVGDPLKSGSRAAPYVIIVK